MTQTLIIVAVIGAIIIFVSLFVTNSKKNSKKKESKPKAEKTQQKEEKKDTSFKISKKERVSKISTKAIETNARTATVERVFEKTPEAPTVNTNVDIPLSADAQAFEKELSKVKTDQRKVVTFSQLQKEAAELEKQEKEKQELAQKEQSEAEKKPVTRFRRDYSSIERYNPEYLSQGYSGFGVGGGQKHQSAEQEVETNPNIIQANKRFEDQLRASFERIDVRRQPAFFSEPRQVKKVEEDDFSKMVEHNAIMNPKHKQRKKR